MGEWNPTFLTSDPLARRIAKEIDPGGDLDDWERVIAKYLPQWQPIETAPRDGRDFLVLTASGPVVAHWREESVTIIGARRGSRGHGLRSPEGWILNGVTSRTVIVTPTHWMPIPAPPTTGDDK